jgi:uncharacterized phage protein gp47/JayE
MLLGPQNSAEVRDDLLTDQANEAAKADITEAIEPGSDNYVWATATAGGFMLCHARIDSAKSAITPLDAEGADLLRWRDSRGLPELPPSPSAGKIVVTVAGSGSVPLGAVLTLPNGKRLQTTETKVVTDGSEVNVEAVDTGSATNAPPGTLVRFLNPPPNVSLEARVSGIEPLTGGFDDETEARLRERCLNRERHIPGGGNVGHLRELAFNASPAVQQCYVYGAIGGPSTCKVVILKAFDRERLSFTRVMPESGIALVRTAIQREFGTGNRVYVTAAADQLVDAAIEVDIPDSVQAGGNGEGWTDLAPWPPLDGADTRVAITAAAASGAITVNASTTTSPVAGQTRVAWWSPNDLQFHSRLIISVTGSTGTWVITPDSPFVDTAGESAAAGAYISPDSANLAKYGADWVALLESLGCSENTTLVDSMPFALRRPYQSESGRIGLTMFQLKELMAAHSEIVDAAYTYRSVSTPTVPGSVDTAPNVLTPRHFGVYPQ